MTYTEHSSRVATELAHLAAAGSSTTLDSRGLDVAVGARQATLQLLRTVLHDVSGIDRNQTGTTAPRRPTPLRLVSELEAHPVAALSQNLASHPAPAAGRSLMDVYASAGNLSPTTSSGSAADRSWARVGRHAVLAGQEWSIRPPRPTPEQQWSAVADVAALAQTVAVLDEHLLTAARAGGAATEHLVEPLATATTSGLHVSAREVLRLAGTGPLPPWGEPGEDLSAARPMLVASASDLAAGHRRLPAQIRDAGELSPRRVSLLLVGQTKLLSSAATALRGLDDDPAGRAAALSSQLQRIAGLDRGVTALVSGDARALTQTAQLVQHLARVAPEEAWSPTQAREYRHALAAIVTQAPTVVGALADHAAQAVDQGSWLVPSTGAIEPGEPLWRRATVADPPPKMVAQLQVVAARARAALTVPPSAPTKARHPAPRDVLQGIDFVQRTRPSTPGARPDRGAGIE